MYLQDLVYIDVAHPSTGGMDSHFRTTKVSCLITGMYLQVLVYIDVAHPNTLTSIMSLERVLSLGSIDRIDLA